MSKIIGYIVISCGRTQIAYDWSDGPKKALANHTGNATLFSSRRQARAYMKRTADYGDKKGRSSWSSTRDAMIVAVRNLGT